MSVTAEELAINNGQLSTGGHEFVLKHVIKNVSKTLYLELCSNEEDHFGISWNMFIHRDDGKLCVHLWCGCKKNEKKCSIDSEFEIRVLHPDGNSICETLSNCFDTCSIAGSNDFMTWQEMEKEYLVNDELIVEIRVQITKTTGIYGENLRNFDDEECSDVTLVVNDRKFHVAKLYLATHSSYFKTMFLGAFTESKKAEVKLSGVDADGLQKYLEALYGEDAINEMTVEGILLLADKYDTKMLVQKCEKFLLESSKKTFRKKLELAGRYNLCELKNKCFSEIKTIEDIRSALPGSISQMDPSIMAALFEKTLSLV